MKKQDGLILVSLAKVRIPSGAGERLKAAGRGREVLFTTEKSEIEKVLDKIEIGMGDVPFDMLSAMPNLKWLQLWSAGADKLQSFPALKDKPFLLTSTSGIHCQQLAEHAFGLMLAWNRSFPEAFEFQKEHKWVQIPDVRTGSLGGKTLLILGYGSIGEMVARVALVFGMNVIGLRRNPRKEGSSRDMTGVRLEAASALGELLPGADYVMNILPATPETFHLFGKNEFSLMKKTALYINVGRGTTTDEAAMVEALSAKTIAGALLDVAETEPLPPASPLWDMKNVILTGHYAGMHPEYGDLALDIALDNLGRYIRGEPLKNLVDKKAGY